jgi:hypothetical protein
MLVIAAALPTRVRQLYHVNPLVSILGRERIPTKDAFGGA